VAWERRQFTYRRLYSESSDEADDKNTAGTGRKVFGYFDDGDPNAAQRMFYGIRLARIRSFSNHCWAEFSSIVFDRQDAKAQQYPKNS
jgi:hypothetical protein